MLATTACCASLLLVGALVFSHQFPARPPPEAQKKNDMVFPLRGVPLLRSSHHHSNKKKHHHKHHDSSSSSDDPSSSSSRSSRYTATQFISFSINTMGGVAEKGECEGLVVDAASGTCYLGNPHNMTHDIEHRVGIVENVLQAIRADLTLIPTEDDEANQPAIDHSPSTLKIVMFPEFFLRGPHGAYEAHHMLEDGALLDMAERIASIVSDPSFDNFMFVMGTVIAAQAPTTTSLLRKNLTHDQVEYFNFAPVYIGGPPHQHEASEGEDPIHSNMILVTKQYISGADFLDRVSLPDPVVLNDASSSSHLEYDPLPSAFLQLLRERNVQVETDNLFELDGVRIGLEICLDHRKGALWETLQDNKRKYADDEEEDSGDLVDVQLITSAGMAIERGPNPVVPGGVVYLTDGEEGASAACRRTFESSAFDPDQVCRETIKGVKHMPSGGAGYSHFVPLSACVDVMADYEGYYSLYQPQGCANTLSMYGIQVLDEYKQYPPSLDVYPVIDLPTKG